MLPPSSQRQNTKGLDLNLNRPENLKSSNLKVNHL